ncbi:MAG: hypothetical protein ABIH53_04785 [archaeon]
MKTVSRKFFTPANWKFIESYADILLIIGCIMVLSIVTILRSESSFLIGREAYSILRLAETPVIFDTLSYGGRFAAYAWGTALLVSLKPDILGKLLPPLIGFISFLIFWGILKKLKIEETTRKISLTILIISPPFIFLFTTLNNYFIAMSLSLLGLYLFMKNKPVAAAISFILLPLFNLPIALITLILLFIITLFSKKQESFWLIFVCTTIISTAYYLTLAKYAGDPEKILFAIEELGIRSTIQHFFSDLGGKFGLSVFGTMLALLGIFYGWNRKYSDMSIFFSITILTVLMFFSKHTIFFMNFFITVFAAYAISTILKQGWQSQTLKNFTILVLICGLLFSTVSFIDRHSDSEPSDEIISSLNYLKEKPPGVAFSHYTRGFWLEYANKKTVMDENLVFAPNVNERYQDSENLFKTRSLDEAMKIIEKYDIKYIWLDESLKRHLWDHDEDGLQFLLKYSEKFKKVYISDEVQVFEII